MKVTRIIDLETKKVFTPEEFADYVITYIDGLKNNYGEYLEHYIESNCSKKELWGALCFRDLNKIQDYLDELYAEAEENFIIDSRKKLYDKFVEVEIEV